MDMRKRVLLWSATLCLAVLALPLLPASKGDATELLEADRGLSVPFEDKELLRYEVNWRPLFLMPAFKAGELTLSVHDSRYKGRPAYTIRGAARSEGLLASVTGVEVRDQFESNIDRKTLQSYRYFTQVRRHNRKRDVEVLYLYELDTFTFRETDLDANPPEVIREEETEGIPGPVADILSVFYTLRSHALKPGDAYSFNLGDGANIKRVHLSVEAGGKIQTRLGTFETVKVTTVGGLFNNGGDLRAWFTTDKRHLPVQFEADAKIGVVYGQIIGHETPRMSRSVIKVG